MCGLCLCINDDNVDIEALTESIKHRGPDSTRYVTRPHIRCGFNRLAIVDDNPASDQPMIDPSGRFLLVFNGEIYNFMALRADLADRYGVRFATLSDTEVLLQGLMCEGPTFAGRLDGIFAFAFVAIDTLEVTLGRDVFGVKPLFYHTSSDRLYVSSEIKPLLGLAGKGLRAAGLAHYLSCGIGDGENAIAEDVRELPPNTIRQFRGGREVYSTLVHSFDYDSLDMVSVDEFRGVIDRTIKSQQPSVPYGVLFSGGLDSTLVLDRSFRDQRFAHTYSINVAHPDMSERVWQDEVIGKFGLGQRHRTLELTKSDLSLEGMAKAAAALDHPLFHPNFIGALALTRAANQDGLKVLLSGEGADELFLGYRWFFSPHKPSDYLEYIPLADLQMLLGARAQPIATDGMSELEIFQKLYLRRWLSRQDLTGMANAIEVRVPFLGLETAQLANRLSMTFKRGGGESKWLIKRLLSPQFPASFIERKKVGFDFPLNDWIGEEHIDFLRARTDIVDPSLLERTLKKYEGSYMQHRIIFSLTALALWMKR